MASVFGICDHVCIDVDGGRVDFGRTRLFLSMYNGVFSHFLPVTLLYFMNLNYVEFPLQILYKYGSVKSV
jgi:hypothetical protein